MKTVKKNLDKNDIFADTLLVRQISATGSKLNESRKGIQVKQDKQNISKKNEELSPPIFKSEIQYPKSEKKKGVRFNEIEKLTIPRQLKKGSIGSAIKMISMNVPKFGRGEAVIKPITERQQYHEEIPLAKIPNMKNVEEHKSVDFKIDLLEEATREIDLSQNQLEKIHSILKNKSEEKYNPPIPKWNLPPSPMTTQNGNSKERVITTLTTLNKKLTEMQNKYFNKKPSYKSIKDISTKLHEKDDSDTEIDKQYKELIDRKMKEEQNENLLEGKSRFYQSIEKYLPPGDRNMFEICREEGKMDLRLTNNQKYFSGDPSTSYNIDQELEQLKPVESNSDAELPIEAQNRMKEKYNYSTIEKFRENSKGNQKKSFCDKAESFSDNMPDILLLDKDDKTQKDSSNEPTDGYGIKTIKGSEIDMKESTSNIGITLENKILEDSRKTKIKNIKKLLLEHDKKLNEIEIDDELFTQFSENKKDKQLLKKQNQKLNKIKHKQPEDTKSDSSNLEYFDCLPIPKEDNIPSDSTPSPGTSRKKIFYDKFGHYSTQFEKTKQRWSNEMNSVPNLPSNISTLTETNAPKTLLDGTPFQEAILKSNYLRKTFTVDQNDKNLPKNIQITKNKSDQFFNGAFDGKNVDNPTKNFKTVKDINEALTKALSNSFYKLPPQN